MRTGDFSFSFLDRGRSPNCQWANFLKMHITYLIHIQNVQERNKIFSPLWFLLEVFGSKQEKEKYESADVYLDVFTEHAGSDNYV